MASIMQRAEERASAFVSELVKEETARFHLCLWWEALHFDLNVPRFGFTFSPNGVCVSLSCKVNRGEAVFAE